MNERISIAVSLLVAVVTPASVSAARIDESNVELAAFGSFSTQLQPVKLNEVHKSVLPGSLTAAEVLVVAEGVNAIPFPNIPASQTRPFASSSANGNGEFGVGVNGFFFQNSLPPHTLTASGSIIRTFTNNSGSTSGLQVDFHIPAPTIRFLGVGENTFPAGADPARDATAAAVLDVVLTTTLPSGAKSESVILDYGLEVLREPLSKVLFPFPRRDGVGQVTRFDEPDGSFGFLLPETVGGFAVNIKAGATMEFAWHYTAKVHTGFGETGVLAAIGDPFNISTGAGISFQVAPSVAVPEPATLATFSIGLVLLGISARRRGSAS